MPSLLEDLASRARQPLVFAPNEVWRVYLGGQLFRRLRGQPDAADSYYPEDWIASMTRADNPPRDGRHALEGLSVPRGLEVPFATLVRLFAEKMLGQAHLEAFGPETRVLAKYLDSAIRLPIQAHPDDALAQKYWNAPVGKTESWLIVDTRIINGVEPYLLLGFKPGIDRKRFRKLVEAQDLEAQVECFNRLPVKPGDAFLVPGRTGHAIGSGVFMIEVQQPSDLVVHSEMRCADYALTEDICTMGKGWDVALDIFDYRGETVEEVRARCELPPRTLLDAAGGSVRQIVGYDHTPFFAARRITVTGRLALENERFYAGAVVAGRGQLVSEKGETDLRSGDAFFVPNTVQSHEYVAAPGTTLDIMTADPPRLARG